MATINDPFLTSKSVLGLAERVALAPPHVFDFTGSSLNSADIEEIQKFEEVYLSGLYVYPIQVLGEYEAGLILLFTGEVQKTSSPNTINLSAPVNFRSNQLIFRGVQINLNTYSILVNTSVLVMS